MKTLEEELREKLDLKSDFELTRVNNPSKNPCFFILQNGNPEYFLKFYHSREPNAKVIEQREKEAATFFYFNGIINTPKPFPSPEGCFIAKYEGPLFNVNIERAIEDIASFHSKSFQIHDYSHFVGSKVFYNDRRKRGLARLQQHGDLMKNLYEDLEVIERNLINLNENVYGKLPKILVHGDLHKGNIQEKEDKKRLFIDFERTYYDYFTWDLARALMDVPVDSINRCVQEYTEKIQEEKVLRGISKENLSKAIFGDCLFRLITDTIADQQNSSFQEVAKVHLIRHKKIIGKILSNLESIK